MKTMRISAILITLFIIGCATKGSNSIVSLINEEMDVAPTSVGTVGDGLETIGITDNLNATLQYPMQDQYGWTVLSPSEDSRLIYVSSSEGDDNSGKIYHTNEVNDPLNPEGVYAFKSILKAMRLVRDGYPDWVLLKKGDEWEIDHVIGVVGAGGRSRSEPVVFTAYGVEEERPLIKTSGRNGFQSYGSQSFITVAGLDFYAYKRNPKSDDFVGWDNLKSPVGFKSMTDAENDHESIVIEDNVFRFFSGNVVFTGAKKSINMVIRRNKILDAYSVSGHGQGIYVKNGSILMEGNLLDHNGWYQQNQGIKNDSTEGQATMFNHNAYIVNSRDSIISNNIITRAASIGLKFTSNAVNKSTTTNVINSSNLTIINNLFIEGEIGISIGGNKDFNDGVRWEGINIVDNVFLNVGESMPTARPLAWHIIADDWKGGSIIGNYLLFNDNENIRNIIGIAVLGASTGVTVHSNVMYGLGARTDKVIFLKSFEEMSNLLIYKNHINSYYGSQSWIRRDIDTYMQEQGESGGLNSFIQAVKAQSKNNWNSAFTPSVVNEYLKLQFK